MKNAKPNIIFFFTDQQRWDTAGCYGQKLPITPNLDKMAGEGTNFEYTFTCQPVCGPARACLQTGKYATEVNCHTNNRVLPFNEETIAKILRRSGYEVAYIGKWHLASSGPRGGRNDFRTKPVPLERRGGYNDFWLASDTLEFTSHSYDGHMFDSDGNKREFPEGRFRADAQTDWVLEYIENVVKRNANNGGKPFFLFDSYIEPHHQNDHHHYEGPKGSKEEFANFDIPGDLKGLKGDYMREYPDYLGCINALDSNLGRIREKLKELGIEDDTILIYTSDHGSHFRTRNFEYKRSCHESSIRVPLVIYGPGFKGGKVVKDLISLIDLPPTILTLAGIEPPGFMKGRSVTELLQSNDSNNYNKAAGEILQTDKDWPDDVFIQISESQCGRAIRTKRWKYSVRAPFKTGLSATSPLYEEEFLYDLQNDPHEHNNLIKEPGLKSIRNDLKNRLLKKMKEANEPPCEIIPKSNMVKKSLYKLKYH